MSAVPAIRFEQFGKPQEVLTLGSVEVGDPGPGEVRVELLAAAVNPSDIGIILGKYGRLPELPTTPGREGVGVIAAVGDGVDGDLQGSWVRFPAHAGVWREAVIAKADELLRVPTGLPLDQAALAYVNPPTALRLLDDFGGDLSSGDWIIQNGANSALGILVLQLAKRRGLKVVNVVRREELIDPLKELGADVVVLEEETDFPKRITELTGGDRPRLALNAIGGESALRLLNALGNGGTHVTFGAMTFDEIRWPTRQLIFEDKRIRGFWFDRWQREADAGAQQALWEEVFTLTRDGVFRVPIAGKYPLSGYADALKANAAPRLGKVLLYGERYPADLRDELG